MKKIELLLSAICIHSIVGENFANENPTRPSLKKPRNVVFILTDGHRYDYMGFIKKVPWLETLNMDRLASEWAYLPNTFVTTSLCRPSRASILTGQFSRSQNIIDNQAPNPRNLTFFREYLQKADYQMVFFKKMAYG